MKLKLRIFAIFMVFILFLSCTSCMKTDLAAPERKKKIDVIVKVQDNDFWKTVVLGAEAAGKEFDVDVNFSAPTIEKDVEEQIKMVHNSIEKKADAIVLAACDYKKLVPVAEEAIDAGIPIIVIDSALDSPKISSFIATDNAEAGRLAGEELVELAGRKCNIGIVNFIKGTATADEREKGLIDVIKAHSNIRILEKYYCFSNEKIAKEQTEELLRRYSDVNVIVALNGPSAEGVASAVQEMNLQGKVKVIGFDSTHEEIDFIESGVIQATIVQNPYTMGYLGVKHALDVIKKKEVSRSVDTGSKVIDRDNMYMPENQKLLFPFVN